MAARDPADDAPPPSLAGPRAPLRLAALALIVVSQLFLLWHSQEPLRLNVGDPWSDTNVLSSLPYVKQYGFLRTSFTDVLDVGPLTAESYRYIHYPPLAEITYGAAHAYLGVDALGSFRLIAIGFSALALAAFFAWARRMWSEPIALVATMLWSTNLLWLMYADSIHQAPIMQASAFVGLWGLARALAGPRERGARWAWAAAWLGCFACFLTSYDDWLFLPIAVLVTVYVQRGCPLRRANLAPVAWCASACVAAIVAKCLFVIGAVGWREFVADLHFQFLERSTNSFERNLLVLPTMWRRATMIFSPLVWVIVAIHAVRVVRARSFAELLRGPAWMLLVALLFFRVFAQLAASQVLTMQVALPFVTVATATLAVGLLRGRRLARAAALALVLVPPLWSFAVLHAHRRSFLEPADIARVNAYLDEHDRNDLLVSNVLADGHVQAYFGRHYWPAITADNPMSARLAALDLMAKTGRDHFHALIFTDPDSRMIDKSLWPLAAPRAQWSVTGWPLLLRAKSARLVRAFDRVVLADLDEIDARVVLSTPRLSLYEVTRARVLARIEREVPADRTFLDLGSATSIHNLRLGWGSPRWVPEPGVAGWDVVGHAVCPAPGDRRCRSVLTKTGVVFRGQEARPEAELMFRTEAGCDVELTVTTAAPVALDVRLGGVAPSARSVDGARVIARFPAAAVTDGVGVFTLGFPPLDGAAGAAGGAAPATPPTITTAALRRVCAPHEIVPPSEPAPPAPPPM